MLIHLFNRTAALTLTSAAIAAMIAGSRPLAAQGQAAGGLTAAIVDARGEPMRDVTVTVERAGTAVATLATDRLGIARITILGPGRYDILAEELGYQPVRMRDVVVAGGGMTHVTIRLTLHPPPITGVEEQVSNAAITGVLSGPAITGQNLTNFDRRHDISGIAAMFSQADVPRDGRQGLVVSGNGLPAAWSGLFVDGVHETLLRHPGLPGEPVSTQLFARDGIDRVTFIGSDFDRPVPVAGSVLGAESARGTDQFTFRPWATFSSAKLGRRAVDNPGDSAGTSLQAGIAMGGSIKHDTASWFLRGDYQRLQEPTADPFDPARTTADTAADLSAGVLSAASTLGNQDVSSWLAPTVRTWKGGSGAGRLDWRFGPNTLFAIRAGGAASDENNPPVGTEAVNGAGARLKSKDFSAAAALTSGGETWTSETRLGLRSSTRDWTGAPLPYTNLSGDAIAIGGAVTLPGHFKDTGFSLSEAVTIRGGDHRFEVGVALDHRVINYDWIPGGAGRYEFGDLTSFSSGQGAFYQAARAGAVPNIGVSALGLLLRDNWQVTPQLELFAGIRDDHDVLPKTPIAANSSWNRVSGVPNNFSPRDRGRHDFGALGGFSWDVSGTGQTIVRGSTAMLPVPLDVTALAEAVQFDGDVSTRRATGTLTWPTVDATHATSTGPALTLFDTAARKPRSFKTDLSLSQRIGTATTLTVGGAYRHADYLLQRQDLNLVGGPVATGSDGRPIFGLLEQFGALLTPGVGTNRRFAEFDMVYALTSSGYNDYYEGSVDLQHQLSRGLNVMIGYTYSKTTDNLPGILSGDPADRLSPFPAGLSGARWEDGKSDLDIPHRAVATLSYTAAGKLPVSVGLRFRYRSGLPFTPGFRRGVDVNGDGSGGNDPAFITTYNAVAPAAPCLASQSGQFALRNSCRDPGVQDLDLRASVPLTHGWVITVDGFNLVGSTTGQYDHAALLVDPRGSVTMDASGHTVLPLVVNPGFGQLLNRRGDPRVLRIGFRVEN